MQIVQTLESINVSTDDISVFHYFKNLITKNFSKVIGRKNKIFSFFEEDEVPQRRYFLKLLEQKYKKNGNFDIENLQEAHHKTFRLNFKESNSIKPVVFIETNFVNNTIIMKLSANEKILVTYMKNYFKDHELDYMEGNRLFIIKYKNENTFESFENFANENEHLKYCLDFSIDNDEYKKFRQSMRNKKNMQWKFNALAKLFSNYFQILECTPENDLTEIRQKYLILVKLYHPDFHQDKSGIEKAYYREQFEKIQIAYDNLKALYKNNT